MQIKVRIITISYIIFLISLFVISYLSYLQIFQSNSFFNLGCKNFTRFEKIESPRGSITDCNGNILASNKPVNNIFWIGTGNKIFSEEQKKILHKINLIITIDEDITQKIINSEKYFKKTCIKSDASNQEVAKILELIPETKNVEIQTDFKRIYPHNCVASHIIGYLGSIDSEGKMGLEMILNDLLKGIDGKLINTVNSFGKIINISEIKKSIWGSNIKTTLDLELQIAAEDSFDQDYKGCLILMDPENGSIIAMLSRPTFDPNLFVDKIKPESWQEIQKDFAFINRSLNASYPPASIFKLITISAALENGYITEDSSWYCIGKMRFKNRMLQCHKKIGHGTVSTLDAIANSCNIPFYTMAQEIPIDLIADYAKKFGLGEKTSLILPEKSGFIPTTEWKRKTKGERWWPGETLSASIGQSFLLVTPIQIACMTSSIFTGRLNKPRILDTDKIEYKNLNIKQSTLDFLKNCMQAVVQTGTAKPLKRLKNFKILAKTGTAQTSSLLNKDENPNKLEHAWVVTYFMYKQEKPLTLLVMMENAGHTKPALTSARKFMRKYAKIIDNKAT